MIPPPIIDLTLPKKDIEHLRLLTIFHYIFGGFALLGIAFLFVHFFFMQALLNSPQIRNAKGGPPPEQMLTFFMIFYVVIGFFLVLAGALNVFSAASLRHRRRRLLSLITAGLNCLSFPFGTALGVFTFIVLSRDSVKAAYDARPGSIGN